MAIKAAGVVLASTWWVPEFPEHTVLVLLSGLAGGVCRWFAAREKIWPHGLSSVIVGGLTAVFLWPLGEPALAPWTGKLEMDPLTTTMFGGFITGLLGISLIGFVLDFGRKRMTEDDKNEPR